MVRAVQRALVLILPLTVAAAMLAGCGDDTKTVTDTLPSGEVTTLTVPDINFAKTKFVIHTGLALGAFHRYIYEPYRDGKFASGADGRRTALVKGGLAALFVYHELKIARDDALASDTLRRYVVGPLDRLLVVLKALPRSLKNGSLGGIAGAAAAFTALRSQSGKAGTEVKERSGPIPGF